jgi:hypothetical protein
VVVGDLIGEGSAQEQLVVGKTPNPIAQIAPNGNPKSQEIPLLTTVFLQYRTGQVFR